MLVLAGPGSGKTRVITERVRFLIEEKRVAPEKILVITFTKAAAQEMKQRYQKLAGASGKGVRFGTFHAIFFMILKNAYHYSAENIVRDEVRYDLLRRIVADTEIEMQDEREFIQDLESEISRVKGSRIDLSNYYSPLCSSDTFRDIFSQYQKALEKRRLIDFDDMLVYCYELLSQREDILRMWQRQFPYILIDEFQDISRVQYDVMRLLAEPLHNLFVVGDDDQSIYGFRGAKPEMMKAFLKDYPEAKQCVLDVNYRCESAIVQTAGRVIAHNKDRMQKTIRAAKNKAKSTDAVEIASFEQLDSENDAIREKIAAYRAQGIPYSEMAVLFRTNTQARPLSAKLMEFNIPFFMKETFPNLYDHWIAQDILAYIKAAQGSRERSVILRIINRPTRYVHRNALTDPYIDFEELKCFYEEKEWMVERIEQLQYDLSVLGKMRPFAAVNFIRRGIGYEEYLRDYAQSRGVRAEDLLELLDELQEEAKKQPSFEAWFARIEEYREELKKQNEKRREAQNGSDAQMDAVRLMTMHGAKGLEFECVFIPDVNEGVTPHSKSVLTADLEEERRMFYVAMTRAKSHLHIYHVKERFHKEMDVSRFVAELTDNQSGSARSS